jgi:hypothetical protein
MMIFYRTRATTTAMLLETIATNSFAATDIGGFSVV